MLKFNYYNQLINIYEMYQKICDFFLAKDCFDLTSCNKHILLVIKIFKNCLNCQECA